MLGGISGYEVAETTDEDPRRVGLIQAVTLAYLQQHLLEQDSAWTALKTSLEPGKDARGSIIDKAL